MEDSSFLPFFFTEEVYVVKSDSLEERTSAENAQTPVAESSSEAQEHTQAQPAKETPASPPTEKAYVPPVYSGLFAKKVLVIVHTAGLNFDHKELLLKILSAIQLSSEDVAILPSGHIKSKEDFNWMLEVEKRALLAFGLPDQWKQQIAVENVPYQLIEQSGYQLLFSENLDIVSSDVTVKQQLWKALKQLAING